MLDFAGLQGGITLVISLVLLAVKGFAVVDAVVRSPASFAARSPLDKKAWLIILGLALAAHLVMPAPLGLLNLVGTVAALVYLAQLRGSTA